MFKPIQDSLAAVADGSVRSMDDPSIKRLFMVLHGFYGNLFFSKFATGSIDAASGEDQGVANARRVWAYALRSYDADTVKTAVRRCQERHTEYPPSLPQFVMLCEAAKPREPFVAPVAKPTLTMSPELRQQRRAAARAAATEAAHKIIAGRMPKGLDALKQAIGQAAKDAGGDEAATLLKLDRVLAPSARRMS